MTTLPHPSKTKARAVAASPAGEVVSIPLASLCRHPDNRYPELERITALARSIAEHGQLEPLVVRSLPDGHPHRGESLTKRAIPAGTLAYQIVSGETRALAQLSRGETTVLCRIRAGCDDGAALRLLAEFNAARSDLSPIEKARLIQRLCQPIAEGGGGLTREAAGQIYGLQSSAGASNLVRLLELPESLQRFVASGSLPQSFARAALPLCGVPAIVAAIADEVGRWQDDGPPSRLEWEDALAHFVLKHTRDWKQATKSDRQPWSLDWCPRRLFTTKEDLGLVELPLRGQTEQRCTNVARWDELQKAAKEALRAKSTTAVEASPRPKTAAEIAETEAEQDQQLARRVARWRHAWLRQLIAASLRQKVPDHYALMKAVLWLLSVDFGFNERNQLRVAEHLQEIVGDKVMRDASTTGVLALGRGSLTWQTVSDLVQALLVVPERNPDMPVWRTDCVEQLTADLQIDLPDAWLVMQTQAASGDENARQRWAEFLGIHNTRQLQALAAEWGVYCSNQPTKAGIVKLLSVFSKCHKLPKCLAGRMKRGGK